MALRPIAFSIPSTTELKVTFSENLSEELSADNFEVESLNAAVDNVEILGVEITNNIALVKTRPQVSGNYYLLKFLDTPEVIFSTDRGQRLIDDAVSRELFFVGIDDVNPIRDRMLRRVPNLFDVENTVVKNIMSSQAKELFTAQKTLGQVLADNYICENVVDEPRTRTAGATDRFANENVFEVVRVSDRQTGDNPRFEVLDFTIDNSFDRLQRVPVYPISLQQVTVAEEEISLNTDGNSFEGFLLNLRNRKVIRLLSVTLIRDGELEDCDGNIGIDYDIERFKYTLQSNFYDQDAAFSFQNLEDNQVLLSEFGNFPRPRIKDTIIVSYVYKDLGRLVLEDEVEVSRVESEVNESVPSSSSRFFLDNAPVVNSRNKIPSIGGLRFKVSENSTEVPPEFKKEITFNFSRLPAQPGEYSVNYQTGEVFVFGATEDAEGTGRNNYVVDYLYRKEFQRDVDYSISDNDLVATPDRELANKEAEISIRYDKVFTPGVDYRVASHVEVMPEFVENRIGNSFSIKTKNAPITDVFRILNQTTGEVYTTTYFNDTEIFFAGNRSPEIKTVSSENPKFQRVANEEVTVVGEFIIPAFNVRITSNISNNSILFEPGIPAELISQNSEDYFIREQSGTVTSDIQIRFFGTPNGENLITSCGISPTATPPASNSEVVIGNRGYIINLDNIRIMNKNDDSLGSVVNTSLEFSDETVFSEEKYFEPVLTTPNFDATQDGGLMRALTAEKGSTFLDNLSRIRNVGDYTVDYRNGIVYLAVSADRDIDLGSSAYVCGKHNSVLGNILTTSVVAKKQNSAQESSEAAVLYNSVDFDVDSITVLDLENNLTLFDDSTTALDNEDNRSLIAEVREDYTVVVPNQILNINSIVRVTDLTGQDLNSSSFSDRQAEYSAEQLVAPVRDGGRNLYDPACVSFENNVIDLKKVSRKRAQETISGDLRVVVKDSRAETFVRADRVSTGGVFFEQDLNITKVGGLSVVNSVLGSGTATVDIDAQVSIADVDTDGDFLLDAEGNRFEIVAVDSFNSQITVTSPAENNVTALTPAVDLFGQTEVVVKPTVTFDASGFEILIPADSGLAPGELLEITYLTDLIPDVGTPLAIDYRYGTIFFDYTYVADELVVWYEYGDNSIDWSISNALSEGDQYFVTYNYGALRNALRKNFGSLTNIPFFLNFPLSIDRELYRSAIKGTLQTFPKGPTIPAYQELVKSFTDIVPNIEELAFGSWILGRDILDPGEVNYSGVLEFRDGKFDTGLVYKDGVHTDIPSISSLPLEEGTLETWIRPDWAGISNDAELTFELDNIGEFKFGTSRVGNPFDSGDNWKLAPFDDSTGGTDSSSIGTRIFNFRTDTGNISGFSQGKFAIYKELPKLSILTRLAFEAEVSSDLFGLVLDNLQEVDNSEIENPADSFKVGSILIPDGTREAGVELVLSRLDSFDVNADDITIESDEITENNLETFEDLTIELELNASYNLGSDLVGFNILDESLGTVVLLDGEGIFYELISVEDASGEVYEDTLPTSFIKMVVKKYGINNPSLSQSGLENINNAIPSGDLKLYVKAVNIVSSSIPTDSFSVFSFIPVHVYDWSNKIKISIDRNPAENTVTVNIGGDTEQTLFYTDLPDADTTSISEIFEDVSGVIAGTIDEEIISRMNLERSSGILYNYYGLEDVYIGKEAYNPKSSKFRVQLDDFPNSPIGIPFNVDTTEGVFIGFDELCTSPFSDDAGQWVFRTRANRRVEVPVSVEVSESGWETVFDTAVVTHNFSGKVYTDGEFSSVIRSFRDEIDGGCAVGEVCNSTFRYCGNELLEEFGWSKIDEADSDLINVVVGGRETQQGAWNKYGSFATNASRGIYRMGSSSLGLDCVELETQLGNFLYTPLPCFGEDLEYSVSLRVAQADTGLSSSTGGFVGAVSGVFNGIVPIHINDAVVNAKIALATSFSSEPLIVVLDGETNSILDIFSFAWNDGEFHDYRLVKNEDEQVVQVYVDEELLSQTSYSEYQTPTFDSIFDEPFASIYLVDGTLVEPEVWFIENEQSIVDIDLIFFSAVTVEGDGYLENTDVLINTDDKIVFSFNIDDLDIEDGYIASGPPIIVPGEPGSCFFIAGISVANSPAGGPWDCDTPILSDCSFILGVNGPGDVIGGPYPCDLGVRQDAPDGYDGYVIPPDGYDGYGDLFGIDEMLITSDRLRYIVDSGFDQADKRFSIFKDGKGFLNFRVYDDALSKRGEAGLYNIATNIKHFKPGELHHVAASWKFNSIDEKDEMHLFVDGLEVPNIYKFGGKIPVKLNDKFSDVSKETLQNFLHRGIDHCQIFTDGTTLASSSIFKSDTAGFTQEMVGRSLIFTSSDLAPTLVGEEYIIKSVIDSTQVILGRGSNLSTIEFSVSTTDIQFAFAPVAGLQSDVLTDLRNSRFSVIRTKANGEQEELGGILYRVENGEINIVAGTNIEKPQFRADIDNRIIEFVGEDGECNFVASVDPTDIDVSLITFGLNLEICRGRLELSNSSYDSVAGESLIRTAGAEPVSLEDVEITRIILERTAIDVGVVDSEMNTEFEIELDQDSCFHVPSSKPTQIDKQNLGRRLELFFDSDNVNFCDFDGYQDAYQDGYLDSLEGTITIYGETTDGLDEETFFITKNGSFIGDKFFTNVERVSGVLPIIDEDYFELGVIEIREADPITVSNNGGDSAEIFDYRNGQFVLSAAGSNGTFPFELNPGYYTISYPTYLRLRIPMTGERLYIGSDFNKDNSFGGVIDEFRIISELSSDTRSYETTTSGSRSVTEDFLRSNPFCEDEQTLALIHFDDPADLQNRRLRTKRFLDEDNNTSFKLTRQERERLRPFFNDAANFISTMINMGFDEDVATQTYYETHKANNGPLFNDADFYRNQIDYVTSTKSVNDNFGRAAYFTGGRSILIQNRNGQFRNNQGTIEFWVSPLIDTAIDKERRYYVDISSATRERLVSKSSTVIELPNAAREVVSVKLLNRTREFSSFYTEDERDSILFDEISRSEITGVLKGGTGTDKEFSVGGKLSADGKKFLLAEALPSQNTSIVVTYIPVDSSGDRVSVFKDENSVMTFAITANGVDNIVTADIDWKKNTWHRVMCTYRTNSDGFDTMRIFVDGEEGGFIRYGTGLIYGTGFIYGQYIQKEGQSRNGEFRIKLGDEFRLISLGSDVFGDNVVRSRMDNVRFSRIIRNTIRDSSGNFVDTNYSSNTNTVLPVIEDDATTLLVDFDASGERVDNVATVIDPANGIFNFDIDVIDNFDKVIGVNDGEVEDLIIDLVERLKPAHANSLVKFTKSRC